MCCCAKYLNCKISKLCLHLLFSEIIRNFSKEGTMVQLYINIYLFYLSVMYYILAKGKGNITLGKLLCLVSPFLLKSVFFS